MTLFRFEAKVISRQGGKSALSASAYRAGQTVKGKTATSAAAYRHSTMIADDRTGVVYDYSRKRGVLESEILIPANAPAWASERELIWNEVERAERRKDAQLARDFVISLPHELDHARRRALINEFLTLHFVDRGYLCDVAYHRPHGKGDDRNHHAHVMVPMRRLDEDGFNAKKDRPEGNPIAAWKQELSDVRESWAKLMNLHLEAAGRPERVSHLSLEAQGIDRVPEPKQGPLATQIEREGRESHAGDDRRRVKLENEERAYIQHELESVVSLAVEALKRGKMEDPSEGLIDGTMKRQVNATNDMIEATERFHKFNREQDAEKEESRKREEEERKRQARGATSETDITDARNRFGSALGKYYSVKDPYATLAQAAMAEWATFKSEQEDLKKQAAAEQDAERKASIELRRRIEAHEYMAITSQRLAGISAVLAGREDAPLAVLDRQRAQAYQEQAGKLRDERAQQQQESDRRNQGQGGAQPLEVRETAEKGDRPATANDAKAAKLAKLEETNATYKEHQASKERSGGRGGRG